MAKSANSAAPRFRVRLNGYPVVGFVDHCKDGKPVVHSMQPVEPHFRPRDPQRALDDGIADAWLTKRQLEDVYGVDEISAKDWRSRTRVRMDLTAAMFEGAVIEAHDEHQARARFREIYGVKSTQTANWNVEPALRGDQLGPFGPKKMRGLLAQQR